MLTYIISKLAHKMESTTVRPTVLLLLLKQVMSLPVVIHSLLFNLPFSNFWMQNRLIHIKT